MKILVTGGSGFLGGYIMTALDAAGHHTVAYDMVPPTVEMVSVMPSLNDRLRVGEIGNLDRIFEICRLEQIDAIVHAAGKVGIEGSLEDPRGFYETNIMGFVNVCEVARRLEMRKVVLISSNSVYHGGRGEKLSESDIPFSTSRATPAAHYGTSKMVSEAIGMAYCEFHGLDFIALRVTAIYGFGMRNPIQIKPMVENAVKGLPTRFADGGPIKRDYTHVEDCAHAVVLAANLPKQPIGAERVMNVAASRVVTGTELAEIVRNTVPGADIEIGAGLTPLDAETNRRRAALDISVAAAQLGWTPKWNIERGVREYADRFRVYVQSPRQCA